MVSTTVKSTFSLDLESRQQLERLAENWGVSRSEALRRAIRQSVGMNNSAESRLAALDALQKRSTLTPEELNYWENSVREERQSRPNIKPGKS